MHKMICALISVSLLCVNAQSICSGKRGIHSIKGKNRNSTSNQQISKNPQDNTNFQEIKKASPSNNETNIFETNVSDVDLSPFIGRELSEEDKVTIDLLFSRKKK